MTSARALWIMQPRQAEVRDVAVTEPGPDEVLVRTECSGISRGTERLVFTGEVPPSEYERMRAPFQEGSFPGPVKYGYCSVGEVERGPEALLGRRVFCLHPHQSRYTVAASAVVPLPEGVPSRRALLAANLETAVNGVWDARVGVGDDVCVVGAGVVGCLVAWLVAGIVGTMAQLVDVDPAKAEVAAALGLEFRTPDELRPEADVVVHASGSPGGLQTALDAAGSEATVLEMSWYGSKPVSVQLGGAFHPKRLRIVSSQVGTLPPWQRSRWTYRRRLELVMRLLCDPKLDALLTGQTRLEELPERLPDILHGSQSTLCHTVTYD